MGSSRKTERGKKRISRLQKIFRLARKKGNLKEGEKKYRKGWWTGMMD